MKPVKRSDHNKVYRGEHERPDGEIVNEGVGDLSCRVDGSRTFAHFKPSADELDVLNDGGVVELGITGHPIPPVSVNVEPPETDHAGEVRGEGPPR